MSSVLATIDIGSNATRFRIFRVEKGRVPVEVYRKRYAVQLGAGTFDTGKLAETQMADVEISLRDAAGIARQWSADAIRAVATSAVRDAMNRAEFTERIAKASGVQVRVIDGEQEARLMALGAWMGGKDLKHRKTAGRGLGDSDLFCVIDIGGGSTELVLMTASGKLQAFESLQVGAVRLAQQWGFRAPVSEMQGGEAFERVKQMVTESRGRLIRNSVEAGNQAVRFAYALGGTPGALAQMLGSGDRTVSATQISDLLPQIASSIPAELVSRWGVESNRAQLILPGAVILRACMDVLQLDSITPTDRGICEGLAWNYAVQEFARG